MLFLSRMRYALILSHIVAALLLSCAPSTDSSAHKPRLVVIIVVDQMRPDYLTRFEPLFEGGLRRLLREGVIFDHAFHDHANTETAVGHATLATGVTPDRHGIVANDFFDRAENKNVYSVRDTAVRVLNDTTPKGSSPHRLLAPTLADMLMQHSPQSKVISIGLKDRAAILMAGHTPKGVYWFNRKNGDFTTSTYYRDSLPNWLVDFNNRNVADRYFHEGWQPLYTEPFAYQFGHEDAFPYENDAVDITMPHYSDTTTGTAGPKFYEWLYGTPFLDALVLQAGRAAIEAESLGVDNAPDLLMLCCSAADVVGHIYGPGSHEIQDYYARLDRSLDTLFTQLDSLVGKDNYVMALASDHGVCDIPQYLQRMGQPAGIVSFKQYNADLARLGTAIQQELRLTDSPYQLQSWDLMIRYDLFPPEMSRGTIAALMAARLRPLDYVEDVYTHTDLAHADNTDRPYESLYQKVYRPDRGPDLYLRFREMYLIGDDTTGTTHGSPYRYDTQIPIVLYGLNSSGTIADSVRSVDLAPTLAELLSIPIADSLSGRSLLLLVRATAEKQ